MIELSPDQDLARVAILDAIAAGQTELVLSGPAGSGKTTLMRRLIEDLETEHRLCKLMAPTGKAAARLAELTGKKATTIHSPLYSTIIEKFDEIGKAVGVSFDDPRMVADGKTVVICDEASMVGVKIYKDLKRNLGPKTVLLCVGDREQLEPVQDTWGANFAEPTALLTQIHRQAANSPIIQLATAIREGRDWRSIRPDRMRYLMERGTVDQASSWLAMKRAMGTDATLLCFTNQLRRKCNGLVRAKRGLTGALCIGDRIVCTRNSYSQALMNGEVREVADYALVDGSDGHLSEARWVDYRGQPVLTPGLLGSGTDNLQWEALENLADKCDNEAEFYSKSTKKRMIQAEYGECLTIHKSQGSQWQSVGILFDSALEGTETRDAAVFRRLLYTAVTRASHELVLFDVGRC